MNQGVFAQAKFHTVVSETIVPLRHAFQVQYIIEGAKEIKEFSVPSFKDFSVEESFDMQNATSTNQQTSMGYMKILVLSPRRGGKFIIPGATAVIDGKTITSNAVKIEVRQTGLSSANSLGNTVEDIDTESESELHPGEDINEKIRKNFFLKVHASKTTCFVGEPLMVVYKAYSRLNASSQVVKRPSLTGFSVLEMVDAYDGKAEIEKLNGVYYYTNVIRKVQLFPLQEGVFTLDPAEIESVIRFVKTGNWSSKKTEIEKLFPDQGTNGLNASVINYKTMLRTDPLQISVKSLPKEGQPANFAGAVGQYTLNMQVPGGTIREGDLVKIQLVVNGSGNLSLLTAPEIDWPKGVDTADPVVKENFNKYAFPLTGSKVFEYAFAAPDTGDYNIPVVSMPYYDPQQKQYKTAATQPLTLHVLPGNNKEELKKRMDAAKKSNSNGIPRHYFFFGLVI